MTPIVPWAWTGVGSEPQEGHCMGIMQHLSAAAAGAGRQQGCRELAHHWRNLVAGVIRFQGRWLGGATEKPAWGKIPGFCLKSLRGHFFRCRVRVQIVECWVWGLKLLVIQSQVVLKWTIRMWWKEESQKPSQEPELVKSFMVFKFTYKEGKWVKAGAWEILFFHICYTENIWQRCLWKQREVRGRSRTLWEKSLTFVNLKYCLQHICMGSWRPVAKEPTLSKTGI